MPNKLEVRDILSAINNTLEDRLNSDLVGTGWPWKEVYYGASVFIPHLGRMRKVDSWTVPKPDRNEIHIIVKVDGDEQLFEKVGWYNSWDYESIDGPFDKVERYEKTVVAYRKIDNETLRR